MLVFRTRYCHLVRHHDSDADWHICDFLASNYLLFVFEVAEMEISALAVRKSSENSVAQKGQLWIVLMPDDTSAYNQPP